MLNKVDWLSFSIAVADCQTDDDREAAYNCAAALSDLHPDLMAWLRLDETMDIRKGRAPYRTRWAHPETEVSLFTHNKLPHALIEIPGRGCDDLIERGNLYSVINAVADRVTRIDIASDILCETNPIEFERERENGKFSARSEMVSESGTTVYVGSRTSERYARVYRYNKPHPRHRFMRVEHVVKAESAKALARTLSPETLSNVVAGLGIVFGWNHSDWNPESEPIELEVYRPERKTGKTLWWLNDTIAPLLVRLHSEGELDVWEWLQAEVVPKLQAKQTLKD